MESSALSGKGVTGNKMPVIGEIWRTVKVGNTTFQDQRFIVVEEIICPVILGIDFWSRVSQLSFNFVDKTVSIGDTGDCIQLWTHPFDSEVASVKEENHDDPNRVLVLENTVVPARSEKYIKCFSKGTKKGTDYLVQPISEEDSLERPLKITAHERRQAN